MSHILIEENGVYGINCIKAIWATNKLHEIYHDAGVPLKDVDFIIETEKYLLLIEYKNGCIPGAKHEFRPQDDKKLNSVIEKYYDSLHYVNLLCKDKPVRFIYIVEYPHADKYSRSRLRERMSKSLPFALQESYHKGNMLIDNVQVMSIDEWNQDCTYQSYPIIPLSSLETAE